MTKGCHNIDEWVSENVTTPVDGWEKRTERRCKNYPWYDPRGWFCWLVAIFVKIVVWVVKVVTKLVTKVVCEIVVTVLNAVAFVVGLVLSIPIIGPIIRAVVRFGAELASQIIGIFDMVARLVGIRIVKQLRVCIIILKDDHLPVAADSDLAQAIAFAKTTFYDQAKVRLTVNAIRTVDKGSPRDNLDVDANGGAIWNELWTPGSYFETAANGYCFDDAFARLALIGGPVVAFVVRKVAGQSTGCSLSTLTDYITVERGTLVGASADKTVLAHELAHACTLFHVDDQQNLMYPSSSASSLRGSSLEAGQVSLLRSSRHVTFL